MQAEGDTETYKAPNNFCCGSVRTKHAIQLIIKEE
jgi:hypothetical protein